MLKAIRGTKDILPEEVTIWQTLEKQARFVFSLYGYDEIRTPILEEALLFNRSLGKVSEIVQKQMFLINDLALRPEATASIVRAYLEHHLDKKNFGIVKLYYIGPMFRQERPQKGRLRQFHHFGCEAIGEGNPYLDAEVISLSDRMLREFGIRGFQIRINTLGWVKDKMKLARILEGKLKDKIKSLCENCQLKFKRNVFRILDCKNQRCKEVTQKLNLTEEDYLCSDCHEHFRNLKDVLDSLNINYKIDPHLVRGLDYYTKTVFEVNHPSLGAQDALGAGGRYDNLVRELGGDDRPAVGFALGVERLVLTLKSYGRQFIGKSEPPTLYIITLGVQAEKEGFILQDKLRKHNIPALTDYGDRSLKSSLRKADSLNAKFTVLLGEDELKKGIATLKDMASGKQEEIPLDGFENQFIKKLS
jgi:histidyl-tRNA synthetase